MKMKNPKWYENYLFMICFDCFFTIFVVLNLVVFVWRIIWDTQDLYLKNNYYLNAIISILISFFIIFYIKYKQFESFKYDRYKNKSSGSVKTKIKLFIIIFSFANINHWRGIWNFTLIYTNQSVIGIFSIGLISIICLVAMNRLCVLMSVPFMLNKDCMQVAYQVSPSSNKNDNYLKLEDYRVKMTKWLFLLNGVQEYIADVLAIQSWRSLWFFMDLYLLPEDTFKSGWVSLAIGIVIYIFIHIFTKKINRFVSRKEVNEERADGEELVVIKSPHQGSNMLRSKPSFAYFNKDLNKRSPIINLDIRENYEKTSKHTNFGPLNRLVLYVVFILGFVGTVSTWRGLWILQMLLVYPTVIESRPVLNQIFLNFIYMLFSVLILWCLNLTSSLLSRASCQDDYFTSKKTYVLRFNNFKSFFLKKINKIGDYNSLKRFKLFLQERIFSHNNRNKEHHYGLNCNCGNGGEYKFQDSINLTPNELILKLPENPV